MRIPLVIAFYRSMTHHTLYCTAVFIGVFRLLNELDGIESLKDVMIVAATNRPDIIVCVL